MGRVTLKTVAEALGVSAATVSNAYNRPDQLSEERRREILAKAEELGYVGPDASARALRRGKTNAVGVILTGRLSYAFSDPYAIGFLAGLSEVLEKARTSITLLPIEDDALETDVTAMREAAVDAVTGLCLAEDHAGYLLARARGLPVATTHISEDPDTAFVAIDDTQAGALIGEHLFALGHRRVGVIVDTMKPSGIDPAQLAPREVTCIDCNARLTGLLSALPGVEVTVVTAGHNAESSGRRGAEWLLDQPEPPTAIVAMSDVLALGVIDVVTDRGHSVPGDVSVAGFDDIPAAAGRGLTTIRQPIAEKGRQIGELLLNPERPNRQIILDCELIVRTSTGPASENPESLGKRSAETSEEAHSAAGQ